MNKEFRQMRQNRPQNTRGKNRSLPMPRMAGSPTVFHAQNACWPIAGELLPDLDQHARQTLAAFPKVLEKVWPLKKQHRQALPEDIAALSRILTRQRSELRKPYWSKPAFVSAYLYYFLPWNLIRLTRLLAGLPLKKPVEIMGRAPALVDAGSGPLTLPLALWLARPEWRTLPLTIFASDCARQPVELGIKIFAALGEMLSQPIWRAKAIYGTIESLAAGFGKHAESAADHYIWLLSAANVLNETASGKRRHPNGEWEIETTETDGENEKFFNLFERWSPLIRPRKNFPAPELLVVEPGTRLGGTCIMNLRKSAIEAGFDITAPCVGNNKCPLLQSSSKQSSYSGSWCHFTFSTHGAPDWLVALSREAALHRQSLALSPLLIKMDEKEPLPQAKTQARVLSGPFSVPGLIGNARYGCTAGGLVILENSASLLSGMLTAVREKGQSDGKSGAKIMMPGKSGKTK